MAKPLAPSYDNAPQPTKSLSAEMAEQFNVFFEEVKACFPAWAQSGVSEQQLKKTWAKGFVENGIVSINQVQCGLVKARKVNRPWLPSIGEFCSWCQFSFEQFGLPSVEAAFREACRNHAFSDSEYSHAAVFVATRETGSWTFKTQSSDNVKKVFERNYEIAANRVISGEDLNCFMPKALPAEVVIPVSKAEKMNHLAGFRERLGLRKRGVA